jgi:hypothetical protein
VPVIAVTKKRKETQQSYPGSLRSFFGGVCFFMRQKIAQAFLPAPRYYKNPMSRYYAAKEIQKAPLYSSTTNQTRTPRLGEGNAKSVLGSN